MINRKNKKGGMAISQIIILIVGIFAVAYAIGSSIGIVNADDPEFDLDAPEPPSEPPSEPLEVPEFPPEASLDAPEPPGDEPALPQPSVHITYKPGEWVTTLVDGKEKNYQLNSEDIDQEGQIKEDSDAAKWITTMGGSVVNGLLTDAAKKTIWGAAKKAISGGEILLGKLGGGLPSLVSIAVWIAIAAAANWAIWKLLFNADVRNMRGVWLATSVGAGVGGIAAITLALTGFTGPIGWIAGGVTLAVSFIISLVSFRLYSIEIFVYTVTAWQAPAGGDKCGLCNELEFGCSEYQCKSFGKACEIINEGTEKQACEWKDPQDIFPPSITALEKVLPDYDPDTEASENYEYRPIEDVLTGVKIFYTGQGGGERGCIPPYTAITLGIETNKFADCRIDTERVPYEEMIAPMTNFEGFEKEHILPIPHVATPSVESQEAAGIPDYLITNGQSVEFFIACESFNGHSNLDAYIMEFCVQEGPDVDAPEVLGTNYQEGAFLHFGISEDTSPLYIYTNEPAECKWSFENLNYDSMQFEMTECSINEGEYMFSPFVYGCKGELTGLKDREENKIYIRCKDKPWLMGQESAYPEVKRFANEESYILTLKGTGPLVIDKITVNGEPNGATIKDNTEPVKAKIKVITLAGAEEGFAKCEYEFAEQWLAFFNEGKTDFTTHINVHNLYLLSGNYKYDIRCYDRGGNLAESSIEFTIETDTTAPRVVRTYYEGGDLKVMTNEPSECFYSTNSVDGCTYLIEDGIEMTSSDDITHSVAWNTDKNLYIKCQDEYGNKPPSGCSIIVRPFEFF